MVPTQSPFAGGRLGGYTVAMVAFLVYLWVIHSQKLPIAQAAVVVGLVSLLVQGYRLRIPTPLAWFGGFVAWAFFTHTASPYSAEALQAVWDYVKLWLVFLLAANVAHTRPGLRTFVVLWLGLYAAYPIRGTLFNFAFGIATWNRFSWNFIFENPNDLAALTLPILALTVVLLQSERPGWVKVAAKIGMFLLPAIIVLTQSRGGILALATFGALAFLTNRRKGRGLVTGVLALGVILAAAPQGVWERIKGLEGITNTERLRTVDKEGSADQRFEIWKIASAIAAEHPITGVGLGVYPEVHVEYAKQSRFRPIAFGERDTHSTYLNILAETGVPGLALFLIMLGSMAFPLGRRVRELRDTDPAAAAQFRILLFGLLVFLQAGLFGTFDHLPFLYLYAAVAHIALSLSRPAGEPSSFARRSVRQANGA